MAAALLLCVRAPLAAQCPPLAGNTTDAVVMVQSGDVSKLRDASGYREALSQCSFVRPQQVIKTGADGYAKFQVSDGSTFEVFQNTELTFRKTNSMGDLLNVWLGKVKVYIQHLPHVGNPNNVTTPTALISVRGTVFDVDVEDADGTTFVTLDEGIVDVRHLLVASPIVKLVPGGSIRVIRNQPLVPLAMDKGAVWRKVLQMAQDAARQGIYQRAGTTGGVPTNGGAAGGAGGAQGDKGKNTGTGTTNTGNTGTGAPPSPGASTGSTGAPTPPPPPPGGGGGE
jgi:hypothetical protein